MAVPEPSLPVALAPTSATRLVSDAGDARTRSASKHEIASYYADIGRVEASRVVLRGGKVVALGLLVRQPARVVYGDGSVAVEPRLWLNFDAQDGAQAAALAVVRAALDMTTWLAEPVYALCESDVHATAPRLLRLCGFAPINETWGGTGIWQKLPQ